MKDYDLPDPHENYFKDEPKSREEKKISKQIKKLEDKKKAVNFKEKVNKNDICKDNNVTAVNTVFYGVLLAIFIIVICVGIIGGLFLGYNNYFKSDINQSVVINPMFNASVTSNIDNDVNNDYEISCNSTNYNNVIVPSNLCDACP